MTKKVLVTGSEGFIGGYVVEELLARGHSVVGLDNRSKYGEVRRSHDDDPRYEAVVGDAKDRELLDELLSDCGLMIAGAAMIGGIGYIHDYPYDIIAENERIMAGSMDAAIHAYQQGTLSKILVIGSSAVFESATEFPSREGDEREIPPPRTSYGFQKLALEYFTRAAWDQHGLPFTIVRPFNCVGIGESRALGVDEISSGNIRLAMSHVVPDLAQKILRGQDPVHILGDGSQVRCYTYAGDLAKGIVTALEHPRARNEVFNISTPVATTVVELAEMIWRKIHGPDRPFRYVSDPPYLHDVQIRTPDVSKARDLLGFEAKTSLDEALDEVIPWVEDRLTAGAL